MNWSLAELGRPSMVFLFSAFALLILAIFSVGWEHPDEHFQIMEFAAWKLQLTTADKLAWEFHYKMRPALQPLIAVGVYNFFSFFGVNNPFTVAFVLRILSASLAFLSMWVIFRRYAIEIKEVLLQKWFLFLSFLLWFALYNGVRFSSENWSGSIFIIGFCYLFIKERKVEWYDLIVTGLILGISFLFRYQAGLLIVGFISWLLFVKKESVLSVTFVGLGIVVAILAGILLDRWFYGEWVVTAWNYFEQNLVAGKIAGFGIEPWWFYFQDVFIRAVPPFSLIFILSILTIVFFHPKELLTWTILPFLLFHFFIGHKETRFFHPLIGFLPIIVIKAVSYSRDKWFPKLISNRFSIFFVKTFWIVNMILIFVTFFNPAEKQIGLYKKIYEEYPEGVTLYYVSVNPYIRAKEVSFYKRPNLLILKADSSKAKGEYQEGRYIIALKSKDPEWINLRNKKVIYSSYPDWLKKFNVNNWMERTQIWNVVEIAE